MLFFDLEFYVPPQDRNLPYNRGSFKFDPTKEGHLLLGGYFLQTSLQDLKVLKENSIWIWEYDSEKQVIQKIFDIFREEWLNQQNQKDTVLRKRIRDSVTCGFSISRIDLPVLFIKGKQHQIATDSDLFRTFLNTKVLDLSNTSSFLFPEIAVLYPKTQREVSRRLKIKSFGKPAGSNVWQLYDNGDFHAISERCRAEVKEIMEIYQKIQEIMLEFSKKQRK